VARADEGAYSRSSQNNPCEYVWVPDPSWGLEGACLERDWIAWAGNCPQGENVAAAVASTVSGPARADSVHARNVGAGRKIGALPHHVSMNYYAGADDTTVARRRDFVVLWVKAERDKT
jgi:hypothetical protein